VPGIVVQNRQNYAQDLQISSRGFGSRATFGVRGIRLIADGIPASFPDGQGQSSTFSLGSARSIEVLRGPFSSLYGNSSGGVISVETEDPPEQPFAETQFLLGGYGTKRVALKGGVPFGIAEASHFETNGYREHSAAQRQQFNTKLRLGVSNTSITLVANGLRQPEAQDPGGLTRALYQQNPRQVIPGVYQFNTRKTVLQEQGGITLSHRVSGAMRVQGTVYGGNRRVEQYLSIPRATQDAVTHSGGVVDLDQRFGGASLRFTYQENPFSFSLGAEHDRMEERRKGFINEFGVAGALKRDQDDVITASDLFAQAQWAFAERWTLHGGLRSSEVKMKATDYFIIAGNGDDSGSRTYRATTPVAGIVFRPNRTTSFYANAGRGFETPTFLEVANSSAGSGLNLGLNASRSTHLELGAKAVVPGWLRVNAALFDVSTRDEIVVETNAGGRASFKNVGHTDRHGFELGAESVGTGPWEARAAFTRLKAVYRDSFSTIITTGGPTITVPAGSFLPGVPRSQLYGEVRYRRERWFAALEGLHKSRVAANDPNSEFADAYTVLNAVVGLKQSSGSLSISEFVRIDNLTDRNYAGSVIVNEGNGRYYEASPRRSLAVGLQARLDF
jgi:iron complex outermembrane receptor protein